MGGFSISFFLTPLYFEQNLKKIEHEWIRIFADFFNMMPNHRCQSTLSVASVFYLKLRRTHVHHNNSAVYPPLPTGCINQAN